jgi:hypothetical protein
VLFTGYIIINKRSGAEKMKRAMKIYTAISIVVALVGTVIVTLTVLPPVINTHILIGIACLVPTSIVSFALTR